MTMRFDAVLLEKDIEHGLTKSDICNMLKILPDVELLPLSIDGSTSSAEGFITLDAAERLSYRLDKHSPYAQELSNILMDMELESKDGTYTVQGVRTLMVRYLLNEASGR